jgi:hypothetical protein
MIIFKNILDKILNKNTLIFIGASLFVIFFMRQCDQIDELKYKVESTQRVADRNLNNYKASLDTIKIEKNAKNELVSKIRSFEFEVNELTDSNSNLIEKYKSSLNINKEIEKVNSIIASNLIIKDSILNAVTSITHSADTTTISIVDDKNWDKYNWRTFSGSIDLLNNENTFKVISSRFDFKQGISLTAGIIDTEEGSILKITSPYPNLKFTRIENINLVNERLNRPKVGKAGWSFGIGIGYGLNLNPGQIISLGPTIGVGLVYSPKWLRF